MTALTTSGLARPMPVEVPTDRREAPPDRATLTGLLRLAEQTCPHRPAVTDDTRAITYAGLGAAARRVATGLRRAGIGPGDRVAVLGPRDARLFVLLYGVLGAGAAVVPLDTAWSPTDRLRRLEAVRATGVLTTSALSGEEIRALWAGGVRHTAHVDPDVLLAAPRDPSLPARPLPRPGSEDPAYLSFTSGSGGEPKAVVVTNGNAAHYALALRDRLGLTGADAPCVAHLTTLAADLGHTSWLLALATGGRTHVVADAQARDARACWASLREAACTVVKTTPSHMAELWRDRPDAKTPGGPYRPRTLILGGEPLPRSLGAALLRDEGVHRLLNHYGPTETTVGATCFLADTAEDLPQDEETVPIGTALGEVTLDLLDDGGSAVPDGEPGQLHIGGRGVSAGYFGRPGQTTQRFVAYRGARTYRTGDLCRRRPDGHLVFLGRSDRQTKIRGYRVDPTEIETLAQQVPGVDRCAVVVRATATGNRLLAAVRPTDVQGPDEAGDADGDRLPGAVREHLGDLLPDAVRNHLAGRLPAYSIPQPIVVLRDFPLGPNGKLDATALEAALDAVLAARAGNPSAAGTGVPPLAREIADLWATALGLPAVDPDADVLELGGDSILAMRTVSQLRRHGHHIDYADFYRHPTPRRLASSVRASVRAVDPAGTAEGATDAAPPAGRGALAPAQRWFYDQDVDQPHHWNQSVLLRCATPVDPAALTAAATAVLARHPALRRPVGPQGPGTARPAGDLHPVSHSRIRRPEDARQEIDALGGELQRSLDPEAGDLIRFHLFSGTPGTEDRLALIAHHLVVDGLSWRVILDDLAHAYRAALSGRPAGLPPAADFYAWAASTPEGADRTRASRPAPRTGRGAAPGTVSWSLDAEATARLVQRYGASRKLEALLLTAFADGAAHDEEHDGPRPGPFTVEVETHGRDTTGEHLDTVGWFTAVTRVRTDTPTLKAPAAGAVRATGTAPTTRTASTDPGARAAARLAEVERRLRDAPRLPMDGEGPRPDTAFNFLGTFRLPAGPDLGWSAAHEQPGTARCPDGDPLYRMRLTARIVEGRLVTDLVHARPAMTDPEADALMARFARTVTDAATPTSPTASATPAPASAPASAAPVTAPVRLDHSASGHLLRTGTLPGPARAASGRVLSEPARVLLTGATGYVGGHLLDALLERGAQVTCLVRGERDADAVGRLGSPSPGVRVVAGDIGREGLGLSKEGRALAREAQVVVHAAADVRLVAPPEELERTNNDGVRRLLAWIDSEALGPVRFHHLSTLAVSGGIDPAAPARRFAEADLRIGQHFRTPYERSKYLAEETVRAWAATGRRCHIHRSGHVAAHSRSGAFHPGIATNRVYQTLRGYLLAGAAPRLAGATFAFSYVDTVAAGIAALALYPHTAPGVHHVETPHQVPHDELVGWMRRYGHRIELCDTGTFEAALDRAEGEHPEAVRLAAAWNRLEDRNVRTDSAHTLAVLDRLGVRFAPPAFRWWASALAWATEAGFLPPPPSAR
ncbi:AMP-binding protein [Streptomyces sp. NBC_01335]|uniref:AMP-binding protein n=1 Tax=Streptomyces sp. NBC_01335 TaxID=2903828 RepID=UPI002E15BACB|nr:AMP-binding protein [Streptomyces sp. NBC_01335]